jgi:ribosome-associated protein
LETPRTGRYTAGMIRVTPTIALDESEIHEQFVRASGPGGQNVNKVSTAVELRFDVAGSPSLPEEVRHRLIALAGRAVTTDGVLVIDARRHRSQPRNRADALARLTELIRRAAVSPRRRRKTRPTRASRLQRLDGKRRRSQAKELRGSIHLPEP